MAVIIICSDFGAPKNKVWHCFHCFPIYLLWNGGTMPWSSFFEWWVLSQVFSHSSFIFIKRLFSFSLLFLSLECIYALYAYMHRIFILKLLIFLLVILIPACDSSRLTFHVMYSAYKLNKQADNIQPWCTPFPIWNQSVVPCPVYNYCFFTWYRLFRRQVR